jgi:hypothetical protein
VYFVSSCEDGEQPKISRLDLVATPTAVIPPDLQIELYRLHAWAGPNYLVSVDHDGAVRFEPFHDTLVDEIASGRVDLTILARLYRRFEDSGYWDIQSIHEMDECESYAFDIHYASFQHCNGRVRLRCPVKVARRPHPTGRVCRRASVAMGMDPRVPDGLGLVEIEYFVRTDGSRQFGSFVPVESSTWGRIRVWYH